MLLQSFCMNHTFLLVSPSLVSRWNMLHSTVSESVVGYQKAIIQVIFRYSAALSSSHKLGHVTDTLKH